MNEQGPDPAPVEESDAERVTDDQQEHEQEPTPADTPSKPGAEGGSDSPAADELPGAPADDDSSLGDTDQHSEG